MTPCGAEFGAERNLNGLAGQGIKQTKRALMLRGVPDLALRRRCHVVRMGAARYRIIGNQSSTRLREAERDKRQCHNHVPDHESASLMAGI